MSRRALRIGLVATSVLLTFMVVMLALWTERGLHGTLVNNQPPLTEIIGTFQGKTVDNNKNSVFKLENGDLVSFSDSSVKKSLEKGQEVKVYKAKDNTYGLDSKSSLLYVFDAGTGGRFFPRVAAFYVALTCLVFLLEISVRACWQAFRANKSFTYAGEYSLPYTSVEAKDVFKSVNSLDAGMFVGWAFMSLMIGQVLTLITLILADGILLKVTGAAYLYCSLVGVACTYVFGCMSERYGAAYSKGIIAWLVQGSTNIYPVYRLNFAARFPKRLFNKFEREKLDMETMKSLARNFNASVKDLITATKELS